VKLRAQANIEASLERSLGRSTRSPAETQIVFDGRPEGALEFNNGSSFEGDQVVDALDPSVEAIVLAAETDRADEIRRPGKKAGQELISTAHGQSSIPGSIPQL